MSCLAATSVYSSELATAASNSCELFRCYEAGEKVPYMNEESQTNTPRSGLNYGSYCCVSWCGNNGRRQRKPGTKLLWIPRDSMSKAWIECAKRGDLFEKSPTQLYATYRKYRIHFTADDFMDTGMTSLKKAAVPTIQPTGYSDCQLAEGNFQCALVYFNARQNRQGNEAFTCLFLATIYDYHRTHSM
ncbi:uncharacterized protein LOC144129535 [Amblyomma americanum]